jgi:hypothetical protein
MDDSTPSQLRIQVACDGATDEELDQLTRQLLSLLRETDVDTAQLAADGPAPAGSKGDPITIGSIAVTALPSVIPAVVTMVQSWISSGPGRTVKFKSKDFEFEGSPEELQKLLKVYHRGNART